MLSTGKKIGIDYYSMASSIPRSSQTEGTETFLGEMFYGHQEGSGVLSPENVREVEKTHESIKRAIEDRNNDNELIPSYIVPHLRNTTEEFVGFCFSKNLFSSLTRNFLLIRNHFKELKGIAINHVKDPEIADYSQISFTITLSDSIENILATEREYYKEFIRSISIEHQQYFVIDYRCI